MNRRAQFTISPHYDANVDVVLFTGNCLDLLKEMPDEIAKLIVTSPPYNLGKAYERRTKLEKYLDEQSRVIAECARILHPKGSICWQIGNYVQGCEVFPLDIHIYPIFKNHGLKLRNRIIWHFEHGLHCSRRFSGRYETIIWFTKEDDYTFNLDAVRVPQKYPGKKYYKGPKKGQFSCHPIGKNPGDLWTIPNVKHNHPEKTSHPCQFPVELIERLVLSMTDEGDLVFDPFMGVGTTAVAAVLHKRKAVGAEIVPEYVDIATSRVLKAVQGTLLTRPMDRPIYEPPPTSKLIQRSAHVEARII
jgi:adenine-specific DNA-methyltransferase